MQLTSEQITTIRKSLLTPEREAMKDIKTRTGDRGGFDHYVPCYLDILVENKTISAFQKQCGLHYWSLKREFLSKSDVSGNIVFREYQTEEQEEPQTHDHFKNDPEQVYIMLVKLIGRPYQNVLDAACAEVAGAELAIYWAFNESAITKAFDALEEFLPIANNACAE